ncbi:MarR family winged helix-turn-helix transcriptional regulator [Caenimonas koreensis]|uniref:MarR family winged helix-turn-helix transcriptional regulator n=1 Tax=Caenimonas koreensis TaxID=367474 RepID=UPI00378370C6
MTNAHVTRRAAGTSRAAKANAVPNFYRPESYKPDESIGYLMRRIINVFSSAVDHELEPQGLTNAQWVPLLKLYMGHGSTVAELASACNLDAGGMTRLLDRLETKGLLRRVRSSEDRRVVNLELTDAGREVAKGIPALLCGMQNSHMRGFTVEEWQLLKSLLRRILDNALALQAERDQQQGQP